MGNMAKTESERQGIQAVDTAGRLLHILAKRRMPMSLSEIAEEAGMPRAQVYRYLVSLRRLALVARDMDSQYYEFGTFASEIGLLRLSRIDVVQAAVGPLQEFANETGHSVQLSILSTDGGAAHRPTVIRWAQGSSPAPISLRLGHNLPWLVSASGLAFLAFLPRAMSDSILRAELAKTELGKKDTASQRFESMQQMLEKARQVGVTRISGTMTPEIEALSAPVYDASGVMRLAMSSVGHRSVFDSSVPGPIANILKAKAALASTALGFLSDRPGGPAQEAAQAGGYAPRQERVSKR
jgi:DNA-binding IclR family transcriptional regulator